MVERRKRPTPREKEEESSGRGNVRGICPGIICPGEKCPDPVVVGLPRPGVCGKWKKIVYVQLTCAYPSDWHPNFGDSIQALV